MHASECLLSVYCVSLNSDRFVEYPSCHLSHYERSSEKVHTYLEYSYECSDKNPSKNHGS